MALSVKKPNDEGFTPSNPNPARDGELQEENTTSMFYALKTQTPRATGVRGRENNIKVLRPQTQIPRKRGLRGRKTNNKVLLPRTQTRAQQDIRGRKTNNKVLLPQNQTPRETGP